jgi:hypothetical protein
LEELGDDAIIAQQQGAHVPKPRVQVTEEARSIVISEHPAPGSHPPSAPKIPKDSGRRRSERTEKTVVIRDRRQLEELRRQMTQHAAPKPPASRGVVLWVIVGVAAFLAGGLAALLATRDESATSEQGTPAPSGAAAPKAAATTTSEPPSVSIDELPIERK